MTKSTWYYYFQYIKIEHIKESENMENEIVTFINWTESFVNDILNGYSYDPVLDFVILERYIAWFVVESVVIKNPAST